MAWFTVQTSAPWAVFCQSFKSLKLWKGDSEYWPLNSGFLCCLSWWRVFVCVKKNKNTEVMVHLTTDSIAYIILWPSNSRHHQDLDRWSNSPYEFILAIMGSRLSSQKLTENMYAYTYIYIYMYRHNIILPCISVLWQVTIFQGCPWCVKPRSTSSAVEELHSLHVIKEIIGFCKKKKNTNTRTRHIFAFHQSLWRRVPFAGNVNWSAIHFCFLKGPLFFGGWLTHQMKRRLSGLQH